MKLDVSVSRLSRRVSQFCSYFLCHLNSLFTRAKSLFEHSISNFRLSNATLQVGLQTRKYIPGKIILTRAPARHATLEMSRSLLT